MGITLYGTPPSPTSVRALLTVEDLRPATEGRPAAELARRFLPEFGTGIPAGMLPADGSRLRHKRRPQTPPPDQGLRTILSASRLS